MGYNLGVILALIRRAAVLAVVAAVVYGVGRAFGRGAGIATGVGLVVLVGAVTVWLPRAAHAAFRRGDFDRAALYYAALRRTLLDRASRAAAAVSIAACDLGAERFDRALRRLDAIDEAGLSEPVRCAWLNNRAYAMARGDVDPPEALRCIDEAIERRPEVAGFRHTRGVALLALGRLEDAIRELDAVWRALSADETPPLLEAERCFDLGIAWRRKGERDYARDYFERAQRAAPESPWAARAAEALGDTGVARTGAVLPDVG